MKNNRGTTKPLNGRLTPLQWIEIEELYRNGWTQTALAKKYGIRVETVSRHMTKKNVTGGDRSDVVREEMAAALLKKQREFSESKAKRQIESKELLFKMTSILMQAYAKEFQDNLKNSNPLAALQGSAKAFKDSISALKLSREELYTVLEVRDFDGSGELPKLEVSSMTEDEEDDLRNKIAPDDEDEMVENLAEEMETVIQNIEHQVDSQ